MQVFKLYNLLTIHFSISGLIAVTFLYTIFVIIILYIFLRKKFDFRITELQNEQLKQEHLVNERNILRSLIDNIPDFIYVKDKYSRFLIANSRLAEVLKVKRPEDLIGMTDHDYFPKELADMFYHDEQDIIKSGAPIINKDEIGMDEMQNSRYLSTTKVPYKNEKGEILGIIGIGRDITKQKISETKLKEQAENLQEINVLLEERQEQIQQQSHELSVQRDKFEKEHKQLRTLIDAIPDYIYFKDKDARFITVNKKLVSIFKVKSVDHVIGKNDYDFFPKEMAEQFYHDDLQIMRDKTPIINKEEYANNDSGDKIMLSTTKFPILDEEGNVFGLVGIGRDITKQKKTESQLKSQSNELQEMNVLLEERSEEILQQSEELILQRDSLEKKHQELRTLIDAMPDLIYFKDKNARFVTANKHVVKSLKAGTLNNLIGKTDFDFFPATLAQKYFNDDMEILKTGKPVINIEEKTVDEMGNDIYISTTKIPLLGEEGEIFGLVGVGRDITELKTVSQNLQKQSNELQELNVILEERQEEIMQQSEELVNQKERITKEHNLLRTLIDHIPDRIYFKDEEAKFIAANKSLAKIMKSGTVDKLIGKSDFEFYPKEMAEKFYADDMEVIRSGKAIHNREQNGWDELGDKIVLSTTKAPLKDENGKVIGLVGIGRDITDLKEANNKLIEQAEYLKEVNVLLEERQEEIFQQSEELSSQAEHLKEVNMKLEKLSIVASNIENAVMIMHANGEIEFVNEGFCKIYGFSADDVIGTNAFVYLKKHFSSQFADKINECIKTKKHIIYESAPLDKLGEKLWLQTTFTPVIEGDRVNKIIAVESDITEVKQAEQKIEQQRDELKVLNSTKDKFFSIIAHDLKNPFHAIIGFTDFLSQNFARVKEEEKKRILELINSTSRSTFNLLENLLNWARTQTNAIRFNPRVFNICEVAEENVKLLLIGARKKNIDIKCKMPELELVFADINMINTVVRNLLTNAIKFTEENGEILLGVKALKSEIEISIKDNGIGIDEPSLNGLFNLDEYKTSIGTSGESGTGLGLIICNEFVRKNKGEISVKSEVNNGTTFYFTLPKPQ